MINQVVTGRSDQITWRFHLIKHQLHSLDSSGFVTMVTSLDLLWEAKQENDMDTRHGVII